MMFSFARSELEAAFASGIGERLAAAVIEVAAAIEDHFLDLGRLAALGDQLADRSGAFDRAAVLGCPQILVEGRGGGERTARRVVDDLGIDVLAGAVDAQTDTTIGASLDGLANARLAPFCSLEADGHLAGAPYFFLPSLRATYSPA